MPRLILASASPRRRELLTQLGATFEVVVADVTEHEETATDPRVMVAHNAALKADWVSARHPDATVLGADTTVFIDQHSLNKPRDLAEARAMLRRLSGRTHTVFTGLAIRRQCDGLRLDDGVASDVVFKPLDDAAIAAYLARGAHTRQGRGLRHSGASGPDYRLLLRFALKYHRPAPRKDETNFDPLRSPAMTFPVPARPDPSP
jgi:septum formation protein